MSETAEKSSERERLLLGRDRLLYRVGIGSLCLSGCALALLFLVFFGVFYADFLTFDGALAAAGAVLGSAATTFAAIGSALLFVVSLRVQARELRHSIEELKNSVSAQREAADNHKQAVAIAEQQLMIAKQEKEFNVCLRAVHDAREELSHFRHGVHSGVNAIDAVLGKWSHALSTGGLMRTMQAGSPTFSSMRNIDDVFDSFSAVDALVVHIYWTLHSINRKDLADDDRQYLNALIFPVVLDVGKGLQRLGNVLLSFNTLLQLSDNELASKRVNRDVLKYYHSQFLALSERKEYKPPMPRQPQQ